MKSIKYILIAIVFMVTIPFMVTGQITYKSDEEIILPNLSESVGYGASAPRDIIHANGKIYVYSFKRILIYSESMGQCLGEIPLTQEKHGRFALQYHNPDKFSPDVKLMTHDDNNDKLYFVTPTLTVMSVSTDGINTETTVVKQTPSAVYVNSLHGFSKLEYDNSNNRLYWFFRSKESNLHSWGSFLGIYDNDGSWSALLEEYQHGSNDYEDLMSTFTFNLDNDDFYVSRKHKIEIWQIDIHAIPPTPYATKIETILMGQEENGKMMVVNQSGTSILLAFPYKVWYDDPNVVNYIYQINTSSPYLYNAVIAPSNRITDALFLPDNDDIMVCYANNEERQINTTVDHDISTLHFSEGMFQNPLIMSTQAIGEVDTDPVLNLNSPFSLMHKADGTVLVSKKNDIVEITHSVIGGYSVSPMYYARDNYFGKGVEVGDKTFVLNSLFGIDFFDATWGHGQKRITFPAFNTEHNPISRKLYIFNRLSTDNTGFFIYDLVSGQIEDFVATDKPIGDLKFNAARNQILVSQFNKDDGNGAIIEVFDGITGEWAETISFSGKDYPGRMLVAPNGKIYISLNMKSDTKYPRIAILDATDFSVLTDNLDVQLQSSHLWSYTLQSHFCYNPHNEIVYATFGHYFSNTPPYQASYNSPQMAPSDPTDSEMSDDVSFAPESSFGLLIAIDVNNMVNFRKSIDSPGEMLCTTSATDRAPGYEGTLFINSGIDKDSKLRSFDCGTEQFNTPIDLNRMFDIEYCPLTNCTYALDHTYIENGEQLPDESITRVYKIQENGTSAIKIWEMHGFASSISFNPYDGQLYVYFRNDEKFLGQFESKVYTLDPFSDDMNNTETDDITLPFRNMNPEIVPQANHPHFDAYNNKAYFPNGTHSSVSVVEFEAREALVLGKDTDWLSIPRLPSNSTDAWNENDLTSTIWDASNFQIPYDPRDEEIPPLLYHLHATPNGGEHYNVYYKYSGWDYTPDINDNKSTWSCRGYQLNVVPDGDNYIYMTGNIKDPATSFPLYNDQKNWVGYFLTGEQDVFDALGASTLENLSNFKHRDFYCYRGPAIEGPTGGNVNGYPWRCDQQQTNIAYGDMIIVQVMGDVANFDMTWQNPGLLPRDKIRPEPSYFEFAETGTYTPILIELNYTSNPLEIGAFVDDSCMGAESVMESDTVIILRAYLNGGSPDSVVFQDWNGTKSAGRIIKDYTVYNPNTGIYENRALMSNTGEEMPRVSFRKRDKEQQNGTIDHKVGIWPNPAHNTLNYSFACQEGTDVEITLLDISGKQLILMVNNRFAEGFYRRSAKLGNNLANPLNPGVYLVKFDIGGFIEVKKLVIN